MLRVAKVIFAFTRILHMEETKKCSMMTDQVFGLFKDSLKESSMYRPSKAQCSDNLIMNLVLRPEERG